MKQSRPFSASQELTYQSIELILQDEMSALDNLAIHECHEEVEKLRKNALEVIQSLVSSFDVILMGGHAKCLRLMTRGEGGGGLKKPPKHAYVTGASSPPR